MMQLIVLFIFTTQLCSSEIYNLLPQF
uniref:Uncharacterized protein n=1 Tax=Arundo donax TaxID=35708 RepID=A0A0A9H2M9_ARUDO